MNDRKMFRWLALLLFMPLLLAIFGGDRFRYPCQDPDNWDLKECKKPTCTATGTCPDQIFEGVNNAKNISLPKATVAAKGDTCAK